MPRSEQAGDRNVPASERRRAQARRDGDVPRSSFLVRGAVFAAWGAALWLGGASAAGRCAGVARVLWDRNMAGGIPGERLAAELLALPRIALAACAPLFLAVAAAALFAHVAQTGVLFVPSRLAPEGSRLVSGPLVEKLWDRDRWVDLGLAALTMLGLVAAGGLALWGGVKGVRLWSLSPDGAALGRLGGLAGTVALACVAVLALLAAADWAYRRWSFEERIAMTPDEARREAIDAEGDPAVRGAILGRFEGMLDGRTDDERDDR